MSYRIEFAAALLLLSFGAPLCVFADQAGDERVNQPRPAAATLQVADGFEVVQVAGPPLVDYPTLACFDDKGRLYVSEGANINDRFDVLVNTLPRSIRRLEDTDGDGIFDGHVVFADKMTFPYGGAWHDGALYVASDPTVWRLEDTNDDGVADRRDVVITGFRSGGLASAMKGGFFGPDGWLYFNGGNERGYDLRGSDGTRLEDKLARPCVFRMRPDGTRLEVVANGAAGVYELCFDPAGDLFGIVTILKQPRGDGLMHWLYGGAYQSSHSMSPYVARTGPLLPPLVEWGQTSPAGVQRYEGNAFGEEYAGNFFTAHFNTHEVTRNVIRRHGATWQSAREETFLKSEETNFRPTDVLQDADGSLLVINTGGWFRIGCPTARVDASDLKGGIYRVRKVGIKLVDDPRGLRMRWSDESPERLVARLDDERFVVRERAIEELERRGVSALAALTAGLQAPSANVRRNVVWALTRIDDDGCRRAVVSALGDPDNAVVLAALHSSGLWRYAPARTRMVDLLESNEPSIRREAACALGRLKDPSAVPFLIDALRHANDRFEEHALIYALVEINAAKSTRAGLASEDPRVCRGCLIALDQMRDGQLTEQMLVPLLATDDLALERAVLDVFARHPQWTNGALELLRRWVAQSKPSIEQRELLLNALWQFRKDAAVHDLVAETLMSVNSSTVMQSLLLEAIGSGKVKARATVWRQPIVRALAAREASVAQRAVAAAATVGRHLFLQDLQSMALDSTRPISLRLSAAEAVAEDKTPLDDQIFNLLISHCRAPETDTLTRLSIARSLGSAQLRAQQLDRLIDVAAAAGPTELPPLFRAFEEAAELPDGLKLFQSLSVSPGIESLDQRRTEKLLERYPQNVREQMRTLLPSNPNAQGSAARLHELTTVQQGGDPKRGRELFFTKATCHACHRVDGKGNTVGPDLTGIGKIRSRQDLLEAVVFPSASFARGYEPLNVVTRDGLTFSGYCGRETFDALHLVTADRAHISIAREDIEEIEPSQVSVMPQGLDRNLSEDELRDVLAFLESSQ
jgi:putative membrane-bound dehydrogenase-like protein